MFKKKTSVQRAVWRNGGSHTAETAVKFHKCLSRPKFSGSRHFIKPLLRLWPEQSSLKWRKFGALLLMRVGLSTTTFRSSCQTALCCVFLRKWVVNDKEKREGRFPQVRIHELNASEPMMKPRKGKRRCQKQTATWVTATECTGNLIIGYTASGVKLARHVFRQ
jgi:hypothetical protein